MRRENAQGNQEENEGKKGREGKRNGACMKISPN